MSIPPVTPPQVATPVVRNDLLKSLHITLLQVLPADTRAFWKQHSLVMDGRLLGEPALLKHVWEEGAHSPLDFQNRVLESLEPFLLQRGMSVEEFVDRVSYWGNRNSFLHAKFLLRAFNPLLSLFFKASDAMSFVLVLADMAGSRLVKGLNFPILKRVSVNGKKHVYTMLKVRELYTAGLTPWDGHLYSAKLLKVGPKALGLPPYDSVETLCDARPVEKVAGDAKTERKDGAFFIDGKRMGTIKGFPDFCAGHGLDMVRFDLPGLTGVEMDEDYTCPQRKRPVLSKGSFYGGPAYIFRVIYPESHTRTDDSLFHFIEEATLEELPEWEGLKEAHLKLVEAAREKVRIEYRGGEDAVYVEGGQLVSGTQAKILRRVLRENSGSGRTTFTFKEFKFDKEIYHSHKGTGFETSLARLIDALEKTPYSMSIVKQGGGKFVWVAECRIDYRETHGATGMDKAA